MQYTLASLAALLALTSATPIRRDGSEDTANDMQSVIDGSAACAAVAGLFARGTFDSGNVGVWVGPAFLNGLKDSLSSVAVQGVDADAYPADLGGYLKEGGSDAGAKAMAQTATDYAKKCPDSAIVLAGWSQGALVAHKALDQLDDATRNQVASLVTFGDPWKLFYDTQPPLPASSLHADCVTGLTPDPLCADLPQDFHFPTSPAELIDPITHLPSITQGFEETKAAASLVAQFPGQLIGSWSAFADNLHPGRFARNMLTPQHFTYGNNGNAAAAAKWVAGLDKVKAAKA